MALVESPSTSRITFEYSVRDSRRATLAEAVFKLPGPTLPTAPEPLLPPPGAPPLPLPAAPLSEAPEPPPHAANIAASEQALARATKRGALHLSPFSARIPIL
jgi:hypothetical protein